MSITASRVRRWITAYAEVIAENRQELVALDRAIGDADHGTNMDRGMKKAVEKLEDGRGRRHRRPAESGRHGAGLQRRRRGGPALRDVVPADGDGDGREDRARPRRVGARRRSRPGVKESRQGARLSPVTRPCSTRCCRRWAALGSGGDLGRRPAALGRGRRRGHASTIPLEARKGRASYLGPRSVGHQDPGATSSHLLIEFGRLRLHRVGAAGRQGRYERRSGIEYFLGRGNRDGATDPARRRRGRRRPAELVQGAEQRLDRHHVRLGMA